MQKDMTKGNPMPIILQFTWPLFLGNVFQQVYNAVDSMIVGRFVGSGALAAVGSTGTIMFLVIGAATGLSTGFTVLTSQRYGIHDEEGIKKSVANGMLLSAAVIILMTVSSLLGMKGILRLLNTPENIFEDAYTYISIICAGIIASVAYNFFSACLRAIGNSKVPLVTLILSACLNVVLDLALIVGLKMGVAGAALATIISQGVSALMCFLYIWKKETMLRPEWEQMRFFPEDTKKQLGVGVPMALQFAITASGTMVMQAAINLFGALAVASYTAASKLQNMLTQGMMAIGQTMATYSGQNYGAGEVDRIKKGVNAALLVDIVYSVIAGLVAYLGLPVLLKFFFESGTDMTQIMFYAKRYTVLCILFYIPLCVIFIFRNTMQGCGYGFLPMMGGVVELLARLLCAVIAMRVMSYSLAVFCDPAAWLAAGIFTMVSYFHVIKKIEKRKEFGSTGTAAK